MVKLASRSWRWWKGKLVTAAMRVQPEARYVFDAELPAYLRHLQPEASAAALLAIEVYAQTQRWPQLTQDAATQLDVRLRYGIFYCHVNAEEKLPPPSAAWQKTLPWILRDCFAHSAAGWAALVAENPTL